MLDYTGVELQLNIHHKDRTYLHKKLGLSWDTIAKFKKGESVSLSVLERMCLDFNCNIEDLVQIKKGPGK